MRSACSILRRLAVHCVDRHWEPASAFESASRLMYPRGTATAVAKALAKMAIGAHCGNGAARRPRPALLGRGASWVSLSRKISANPSMRASSCTARQGWLDAQVRRRAGLVRERSVITDVPNQIPAEADFECLD